MAIDQAGACDDAIVATIDGVWGAAGLDRGDVWLGDWMGRTPDMWKASASLPEPDRWYAYRISGLAGDRCAPRPLFDDVDRFLDREGFDVRRYRAPLSGRLELRAHREELTVIVAVSTNGAASVQVFAGPCAPFIADEPPEGLVPLP